MKKIICLIIASVGIIRISYAQNVSDKIALSKNQELVAVTTVNGLVSIEMMGQNMETISESAITRIIEVKDITPSGYMLTGTTNKMKVKTKGGLAPAVEFDSDKKEDMNSEIGKSLADKFQPKDMEITFAGKSVEKKDTANEEDMATIMQSVISGNGDNDIAGLFMLLPPGKKQGDVWSDSSGNRGIKINNTYTLKQIIGNEATIAINTVSIINKTMQVQGAALTIIMNSKIYTNNIIDITTGIIKEKKTTIDGAGNLSAGGMEMPMATKVTMVTTVKNL